MVRMKSPPTGSSTLMTSAPSSPSSPAQNGAEMRVPTSRTRIPWRGPGGVGSPLVSSVLTAGPVSPVAVGEHLLHGGSRLAFLESVQGGGGVVHPVMGHEVVLPRGGLSHEIGSLVDGVLHQLCRGGRDQGDPLRQLTCPDRKSTRLNP